MPLIPLREEPLTAAAAPATPHLMHRFAALLRAATMTIDNSVFHRDAEQALAEYDAKGYTEEEPLFVLRGRDELAADAVRHWGAKACVKDVAIGKVAGALEIARLMEAFPDRRLPD